MTLEGTALEAAACSKSGSSWSLGAGLAVFCALTASASGTVGLARLRGGGVRAPSFTLDAVAVVVSSLTAAPLPWMACTHLFRALLGIQGKFVETFSVK